MSLVLTCTPQIKDASTGSNSLTLLIKPVLYTKLQVELPLDIDL